MNTSIVTGAGGFVGSAVAEALMLRGDRVVCVAHLAKPPRHRPTLFDATWAYGDVADGEFVRDLFARYQPDEVYHYAASSIVKAAKDDPVGAVRTNVLGTACVLDACRTAHMPKVALIASSDKAYGEPPVAVAEDDALRPTHLYDATKAAEDFLALAYATDHGVPVVITRSANIYGPGDLNWSRVIPGSCRRLYEGGRPLLYTDAAKMIREFVYIADYVSAALFLARRFVCGPTETERLLEVFTHPAEVKPGSAWNIGTGDVLAVGALVDEIIAASGRAVTAEIRERVGFSELVSQSVKADKIRALGWKPTVPLREGLGKAWDWYANYLANGGGAR